MESTQKQFDHANGNYILDNHGPKKALKTLWKKNNFKATSAPFVYDGILYIAVDGFFYAINPDTGNTIWEFEIPAKGTMPVFYEDILIFGGLYLDNYIYAFTTDTGKEIWKYYTGAYAASVYKSPVIHNDLIYALAGRLIHCLSLSGKKQWSFGLKKKVGHVNLVIDSDKIYAVTNEGMHKQELHCVDINKKELLWKIKTPNFGSNLLKIQDYLFYLNREAELCQVNLATQEIIKSKIINVNDKNRVRSLRLVYHDGIMVIAVGNYILGLNISTDPWSWQWNFHSFGIIGTPVIADNCIYFSTIRNGVIALDLYTGKKIFHKESEVRSDFACGIYDSKIFVAGSSNEHEFTAYGE